MVIDGLGGGTDIRDQTEREGKGREGRNTGKGS